MFRKTYKDAVDDIEINKDLKESLMLKAQEIPQPSLKKSTKKPKIYMVSGFAAAAAAVAVSVIALNNTDIFGNNSELIKNETSIQYNNTEQNEKAEKTEKSECKDTDVTADVKTAENQTLPKQNPPKSDSPKKTEQAQTSEKQADNEKITQKTKDEPIFDSVIKEEAPETQKQSDASDIDESASDSTAKTEAAEEIHSKNASTDSHRSSGGSGGAAQKNADTATFALNGLTEKMTLSEYADYLGADVEKSLVLPKDMKSETGRTAYISKDENGDTAYDDFCFYYTGENDRYVSVITSKNTEYAQEMLLSDSYKKVTVNGLKWAISENSGNSENEDFKTAVTVKNDVSFTVNSYKLTDSEQEKILISISEIEIK